MKSEKKLIGNNRVAEMVFELQRAASETSTKVSDLLLKAWVIAEKLQIIDQQSWIQSELNGYPNEEKDYSSFPPYRFIKSRIESEKCSPSGTVFEDPLSSGKPAFHPHENSAEYPCHVSIAEIERTLNKTKDNYVHISCMPYIEKVFVETLDIPPSAVLTVQASRLHGILNTVRNIILDWTLKLEENRIIAEDPPAQTGEREPQKPTKKRAYTQWPKTAQATVGKLWVSFRGQGREMDCYESHKGTARLPDCIKSLKDFKKCKDCAKRNGFIPPLRKKRGKDKGKTCQ